jgi:hypothetical protein
VQQQPRVGSPFSRKFSEISSSFGRGGLDNERIDAAAVQLRKRHLECLINAHRFASARTRDSIPSTAGVADVAGGATAHAVLWQRGAMRDLGTLAGPDGFSYAELVNDRHGFRWQNCSARPACRFPDWDNARSPVGSGDTLRIFAPHEGTGYIIPRVAIRIWWNGQAECGRRTI